MTSPNNIGQILLEFVISTVISILCSCIMIQFLVKQWKQIECAQSVFLDTHQKLHAGTVQSIKVQFKETPSSILGKNHCQYSPETVELKKLEDLP